MTWKEYSEKLEAFIKAVDVPESTRILLDELVKRERDKVKDFLTKYILVEWPEYQYFMDGPRWKECIMTEENSYMIPEDLYWSTIKELDNNIKE